MTVWDKIYKNFQNGGQAWATLSEEIHPLFRQLLKKIGSARGYALDLGCGTGRYLKILKAGGFKVEGVDSSEIVVEMTRKVLGEGSKVVCADIYEFAIKKEKYNLIISVSSIHHGTKEQVQTLMDMIHEALTQNGRIFITVPDFASSKKWGTFRNSEEIDRGTFAPLSGQEKGLPHSFYCEDEARELFSRFRELRLDLDSHGRWVARASK